MERKQIESMLGVTLFPYQNSTIDDWESLTADPKRLCIYHPTGKGKTIASLACMAVEDYDQICVIAPPVTHDKWIADGRKLGIEIIPISHAKFRQDSFKVDKTVPIICDEFHLLGGHKGKGWKKFNVIARYMQVPIIICSATPNYNDAERCYCIQAIVDPPSVKGGYLNFIYQHCITEQNPFGATPIVTGFIRFNSAAEYLNHLPQVTYLEDEVQYTIQDVKLHKAEDDILEIYGYNYQTGKMVASLKEKEWARTYHAYLFDGGEIRQHILHHLYKAIQDHKSILVFCASSKIAQALALSLPKIYVTEDSFSLVTGETSATEKAAAVEAFRQGKTQVLIGTATLATGTDGLDKVCNYMLIMHDTDDASLRRQLVGRILPRGKSSKNTQKTIERIVF